MDIVNREHSMNLNGKKVQEVFILYDKFMDYELESVTLGGVQSYIIALSQLMTDLGWNVHIVQSSTRNDTVDFQYGTVHGRDLLKRKRKVRIKKLYQYVKEQDGVGGSVLIWASFYDAIPDKKITSIGLQHGIAFDYLGDDGKIRRLGKYLNMQSLMKLKQRYTALNAFEKSEYRVCVDYNFLNWYRTYKVPENNKNIKVIPNFSEIYLNKFIKKDKFRKIIFARRFSAPRGVVIAVEAAQYLLGKYSEIKFVFAGEGDFEEKIVILEKKFPGRVIITKYKSEDSISIHRNQDIAIIPTLGSEGTSLSLLEAMTAGCVVICTNVGGMTNIVIDRFNGLMIDPSADSLINAIECLYHDNNMANELVVNAKKTVQRGFSKEIWRERWISYLNEIVKSKRDVLSSADED